jgi:DNA excision repair protein ERCC-2
LIKDQSEPYAVSDEPPKAFVSALQDATGAISDHLADSPTAVDSALLQFYFDAFQFMRLLDAFGTHSLFDVTLDSAQDRVGGMKAPRTGLLQSGTRETAPATR